MQLIADKIDAPLEYLKFSLGSVVKIECKDQTVLRGKLCVR